MAKSDWFPPEDAVYAWERSVEFLTKNITVKERMLAAVNENNCSPDAIYTCRLNETSLVRCQKALRTLPKLLSDTKISIYDADVIDVSAEYLSRWIWDRVSKISEVDDWALINAIVSAYVGPYRKTELMPKKQRKVWREGVEKNLGMLFDQVIDTRLNNFLDKKFEELESRFIDILNLYDQPIPDDLKTSLTSVFQHPPLLSSWINELIDTPDGDIQDWYGRNWGELPEVFQARPGGNESHRNYFAVHFSNFLTERTGSIDRKLVVALVGLFFGFSGLSDQNDCRKWLDAICANSKGG